MEYKNERPVMRCSEATRHLQLYIDSQLTLDQVRVLEAHMAFCPACRNECLFLEDVTSTLGGLLKYPQYACDRKCWPPDFGSLGGWYSYWRLHHPGSGR